MKRVIAIGLFVNAALLAGILLKQELVVHAAVGGGGTPVGNGDVNGDGQIDISDVAYLLNALFLGGPDLKAIECPPPAVKGLPATGQTQCYNTNGTEVDCTDADCPGQDSFYVTGCPSEGRFVDNGDGTVTDNCTGLMWQKDTADTNGDGQSNEQDGLPWCDALAYSENLSFAGHDDWRLPNVRELQSIVDYGRFRPAIDPIFGAVSDWYCSSSTIVGFPGVAWFVDFLGGGVDNSLDFVDGGKDLRSVVRAVRSLP